MNVRACRHAGTQAQGAWETCAAFTLLELLVVLALIGLAASVVSVHLHGATDAARLRAATLQIEQTLHLARQRALMRHETVSLVFEIGGARCRLVFGDQAENRDGAWHTAEGVTVRSAAFRGQGAVSAEGEEFAVRLTPTGASLPWAVELWTHKMRRIAWTDGISGRLGCVDGIGLHEFRWNETDTGS